MALKYAVVIEKGPRSFGASVPDLPGCVAVHKTEAGVRRLIQEAIEFHVEGLRAEGMPVPAPTTQVADVPLKMAATVRGRLVVFPVKPTPAKRRIIGKTKRPIIAKGRRSPNV